MVDPTIRRGSWMQTYSGVQFWPMDPRPEDVNIVDIAHALSHLCRFGGHCREFYSVAQHSVHVADIVRRWGADRTVQFAALLHDATEAYVVDVPRPLKMHLGGYREAEQAVELAVHAAFGIVMDADAVVTIKHADEVALATEKRDIMHGGGIGDWGWLPQPDAGVIVPMRSEAAMLAFVSAFDRLRGGR